MFKKFKEKQNIKKEKRNAIRQKQAKEQKERQKWYGYETHNIMGKYGRILHLERAKQFDHWNMEMDFNHRKYTAYLNDDGKVFVLLVDKFVYEKDRDILKFENMKEYKEWRYPKQELIPPDRYTFGN